ncbi:hypothetical protein SESBI_29788 [Sesbania bispinosa]|nr:hypothetical protein SESBI_29788 [Sesbania bispinosa]
MSNSVGVALLVLLVSLTYGDSVSHMFESDLNDSDINILFLSIVNELPPNSASLYFVSSFQKTQYLLEPGKPYTKFTNFEVKECTMIWAASYARFKLYDPSTEGGHQRIFWSARSDGIYHSWDHINWDKRAT